MTAEAIRGVVGHLRRAAAAQVAEGLTDGALLDRFIHQRDPAAFADLVRRHGPMVLGVCRRVLGGRPDVEDAFQAIFLVLVQKAPTIVPRDMVANWLHGVAYRTAVRVRAGNLLRQHREKQMATVPEPATVERGWDDLRPLLDEELGRLPPRYRTVLVLCDMEGRTRKDAARHLRCPEGTVSTWLTRAAIPVAAMRQGSARTPEPARDNGATGLAERAGGVAEGVGADGRALPRRSVKRGRGMGQRGLEDGLPRHPRGRLPSDAHDRQADEHPSQARGHSSLPIRSMPMWSSAR